MPYALKIFFTISLVILVTILLLVKYHPQNEKSNPKETSFAQTTLFLDPDTFFMSDTANTATIYLNIDTSNIVKFIQVKISFDPKTITNIEIPERDTHPQFTVLEKHIDTEKGIVTLMLNIDKKEKGITGKQLLATMVITTDMKVGEKTILKFTPETLVTDDIHATSVLKQTKDATIIKKVL